MKNLPSVFGRCLVNELSSSFANDASALWELSVLLSVGLCIQSFFVLSSKFGGPRTFSQSSPYFETPVTNNSVLLICRASAEEMRSKAAAAGPSSGPSEVPNSGMKSSLVDNAQPVGFTGSPFDSNV